LERLNAFILVKTRNAMTALKNQKCKIQPRFKTLKTFLGNLNAFIPAKILSAMTALKN
jgi:hypothetical protein